MASHSILAQGFASGHAPFSLRRVWTVTSAMLQASQSRRVLAELDSRLLADIGIGRADAVTEANRSFWDIR